MGRKRYFVGMHGPMMRSPKDFDSRLMNMTFLFNLGGSLHIRILNGHLPIEAAIYMTLSVLRRSRIAIHATTRHMGCIFECARPRSSHIQRNMEGGYIYLLRFKPIV